MTGSIYEVKAKFFKTLAHRARIRVLELLRIGERSVSELIPDVGSSRRTCLNSWVCFVVRT